MYTSTDPRSINLNFQKKKFTFCRRYWHNTDPFSQILSCNTDLPVQCGSPFSQILRVVICCLRPSNVNIVSLFWRSRPDLLSVIPNDAQRGAWRFDTLWGLSTHMMGSSSFPDRSCVIDELESAFNLKRGVVQPLQRTTVTFLIYTTHIETVWHESAPDNQSTRNGYKRKCCTQTLGQGTQDWLRASAGNAHPVQRWWPREFFKNKDEQSCWCNLVYNSILLKNSLCSSVHDSILTSGWGLETRMSWINCCCFDLEWPPSRHRELLRCL